MNNASTTTQKLTMAEIEFRATGRYVDDQVAKGLALDDVLALGQKSPSGQIWFDKENLRPYSLAVAASFGSTPTELVFRGVGRYVDDQVAKGRALEDVLAIEQKSPSGQIWFDANNLRPYSLAVAASFEARSAVH